ncbi:MAG: aspartate ammonia-lyase [Candidatus Mycalebacterium zealandia]|nr:MAG: aspartate ammonia-lyase [Candidatus Mycalebacterium zealandia]
MKTKTRIESDSMGKMRVPAGAYYGAQTARAVENFPVSGTTLPRSFTSAVGIIKSAAAQTNMELGLLGKRAGKAIVSAAGEVVNGKLDAHFVVDVFQTGSGTSTNMNANEVIANRANEILGGKIGDKSPVHPNDHVNMGQSSNDVIPSATHISTLIEIHEKLLPALAKLEKSLARKSRAFSSVVKIGRTHLQDATPVTLGQEFGGYAAMISQRTRDIKHSCEGLRELALGGTAVGTGINTHKKFGLKTAARISRLAGTRFVEAKNHFEAQSGRDAVVQMSGSLKTLATSLMKISNDIRWLGSGPRCGFGEIDVPAVQPGSSIMPGKVNPVMAESLTQVCAQVIGNDSAITVGGQSGNFELNVMMPMMANNLLNSVSLLSNICEVFTEKCVDGIMANKEQCEESIEKSLAMCTSLAPVIGYDSAAAIAKEAYEKNKTVRETAEEKKILPKKELDSLLDARAMTGSASLRKK